MKYIELLQEHQIPYRDKEQLMKEERLLVCGSRYWSSRFSIYAKLELLRNKLRRKKINLVVITGGAPGADSIADKCAEELGIDRIVFPANWTGRRKAAGPIRNSRMLKDGRPTMAWAFHRNLKQSKGTKDMVIQLRRAGIKAEVFDI